jgi:hypothetical protein
MNRSGNNSVSVWSRRALVLLACVLGWLPVNAQRRLAETSQVYMIANVRDVKTRSAIVATGATIVEVGHDYVLVEADRQQALMLRQGGLTALDASTDAFQALMFPAADSAYHDYDEMVAELQQVAAAHPEIFSLFSIGTSFEGRTIWAGKISDNVNVDEDEPEVLFTHHQHAREHLTIEEALYTLKILTDEYGSDPQITTIVDSRELWMVFDVNPDGGEYDIATGTYRSWRKNRQPNPGSSAVGTDLNRNWGYRWGCCEGSSSSTSSQSYRGAAPLSAPETTVVRDFVDSRVINGVQQIIASIDFHTYAELVMWPYGYTYTDVPSDMTQDDYDVFVKTGSDMAAMMGYTPQQGSDLYISDGTIRDYLYGAWGIMSYTIEMYPTTQSQGGFYPPDEVIPAQTERTRGAVLYFLEQADCPYRAIGKEAQYCAGARPTRTEYRSPAQSAAVTSSAGDNNGFSNAANAFVNDGLFAMDVDSGNSSTSTSCTSASKDKHRYFTYGLNIPAGATVRGIEVRLDAKADSTSGTPRMCVQLSSDGGATWTAAIATGPLSTSERTYLVGGPQESWGRAWSPAQLSDPNFRVRIANVAASVSRDFSLDWLAVRVTYVPPPQ